MSESRVWGQATIYDCKEIGVHLENEIGFKWLQIRGEVNGNRAQLTMFFKSQQDQDAVIQQLYSEVGKLLPKF